MDIKDLESYFVDHKRATVAEVQQRFGLKYGEVREAFQTLQKEGKIRLKGGVTFEWCVLEPKDYDEMILRHRKEMQERLAKLKEKLDKEKEEEEFDDDELDALLNDDDEDDDDDVRFGSENDESKKVVKWAHGEPTLAELGDAIKNRLAVFGIELRLMEASKGAAATRFVFDVLSKKTRLEELKNYAVDIQSCIDSPHQVHVVAPVSGARQVAVEIVNTIKSIVSLDDVLKADSFRRTNKKLAFAVGTDLTNNAVVADLAELPHLLVAGTVGSGKSMVLNSLIISLAKKYSPDYVKILMVDTKCVELTCYDGLPHMLTPKAVTTAAEALAALDYLIEEMDSRYMAFRENGVGNIAEYNKKMIDKLPYLVFVVDEFADVISCNKSAFEIKLQRLAQKSRASGIHLVLATQRPDVRTITGAVKANFPARIALKAVSKVDSVTIMGASGAETLSGMGDMLFVDARLCDVQRLQGAYVSHEEILDAVEQLKRKYPCKFDEAISQKIILPVKPAAESTDKHELDPLCKQALRYWLEKQSGRASIASIQRSLGIGFNRAGRIMDSLQKLGYVETLKPNDPVSKPMMVLVSLEMLDLLFPDIPD